MRLMRITAAAAMLAACGGVAGGEEQDVEFQVKVTGTDGLRFSGFYELTLVDTVRSRTDVQGTVPAAYALKGDAVTFSVAKESAGTLKIEIVRDGKVYDDEQSSAPGYAQLTVSHDF